jgi:hypothetical protein
MKKMTTLLCCALLGVVATAETVVTKAEPVSVRLKDGTDLTLQATYEVDLKVRKPEEPKPRKVALMVDNLTDERAFDKVCRVLGNQVASQVVGANVEILLPEDNVLAIAPRRERDEKGNALPTQDERLLGDTSRVRLAENMGADYLLMVTLDKFTKTTRRIKDRRFGKAIDNKGGVIVNEIYNITGTYRVTDVYSGSSFDGGVVKAQTSVRQTAYADTEFGSFADGLEEDLAEKMAELIREKAETWRAASLEKSGIPVDFTVLAYDMNNKPIYLPAIKQDNNILHDRIPAEVAATIEVDGVARGTSSCTIRMSAGMHKVRIRRVGYDDLTMTVVPSEGLALSVSMRMTDAEYARIKDSIEFMHRLTIEREQSQAMVAERLGHAKMLEQSGIRVEADEMPEVMTGSASFMDFISR